MPIPNEWLIRDARNNPDGLLLWWGPNRAGYTTRLDEAGRYSEQEAKQQAARRDTDEAVPFELAERFMAPVVPASLKTIDALRVPGALAEVETYKWVEARLQEQMDRADKAEEALTRLEDRIHEAIQRCAGNPQHEGTFPQVDRFAALLQAEDLMGNPWPLRNLATTQQERAR